MIEIHFKRNTTAVALFGVTVVAFILNIILAKIDFFSMIRHIGDFCGGLI